MADIEFILSGQFDCDFADMEFILSGAFEAGDILDIPASFVQSDLERRLQESFESVAILPTVFGELWTYYPPEGSPVSVFVSVDFTTQSVEPALDGRRRIRDCRLHVAYSSLVGILDPSRRGRWVGRGETWSIDDIGERQGGCWSMRLTRSERQENTVGSLKRRN